MHRAFCSSSNNENMHTRGGVGTGDSCVYVCASQLSAAELVAGQLVLADSAVSA
jgi:hypothetical protein